MRSGILNETIKIGDIIGIDQYTDKIVLNGGDPIAMCVIDAGVLTDGKPRIMGLNYAHEHLNDQYAKFGHYSQVARNLRQYDDDSFIVDDSLTPECLEDQDGFMNTQEFFKIGGGSGACEWCAKYCPFGTHTMGKWYLPAIGELLPAWKNIMASRLYTKFNWDDAFKAIFHFTSAIFSTFSSTQYNEDIVWGIQNIKECQLDTLEKGKGIAIVMPFIKLIDLF